MAELGFESRTMRLQNQHLALWGRAFSVSPGHWPCRMQLVQNWRVWTLHPPGEKIDNRSHSAEAFSGFEQDAIKPVICYDHLKHHLEMRTLSNKQFRWCRCPCLTPVMSVLIILDGRAGNIFECLQNEQLEESDWLCSLSHCRILTHTRAPNTVAVSILVEQENNVVSAFGKTLLTGRVVTSWGAPFCSGPQHDGITFLCSTALQEVVQHGSGGGRLCPSSQGWLVTELNLPGMVVGGGPEI